MPSASFESRYYTSSDGLKLHYRDYPGPPSPRLNVLCIPSLTRNGRDFEDLASPDEVSTFVRVDRFNDSSIDMLLYCFTRTTDWGAWLKIKEELAYKMKEIVEGAGTGFAFPSQSLYVHTLPSEKPDVFTPPADD
jgi:small-conductance mechanosensitive channel